MGGLVLVLSITWRPMSDERDDFNKLLLKMLYPKRNSYLSANKTTPEIVNRCLIL